MAATNRSIAYSTQFSHISSGASMAAGVVSASTDISSAISSTNTGRYDRCDVQLFLSNTASISSASNTILLMRRDLNFAGTNDEPIFGTTATSAAYSGHVVGVFVIPPFTAASTSYHQLLDVPLADECEFGIQNNMNTAIGLGWTLQIKPKTDSFA